MKGIIIAAGPCKRLRPFTEHLPKCMLKINGKPIVENIMDLFRKNGINDISIVVGHKKEKITYSNITYFENMNFWDNNVLHSFIFARPKLEEAIKTEEDVVVTYSDILFEDTVLRDLLKSKDDIASIIDTDWIDYYEGRTDHPISEAENVIMDKNKRILKIGKDVFTDGVQKERHGEFIGLWKFTPNGIKIFLKHFDRLNSNLKMTDPYQNMKEWQKSYITDIFQEMIDKGEKIYGVLIQKKWKEFDTVQDFLRAGGEMPEGLLKGEKGK